MCAYKLRPPLRELHVLMPRARLFLHCRSGTAAAPPSPENGIDHTNRY